jgi:hypothetical protein
MLPRQAGQAGQAGAGGAGRISAGGSDAAQTPQLVKELVLQPVAPGGSSYRTSFGSLDTGDGFIPVSGLSKPDPRAGDPDARPTFAEWHEGKAKSIVCCQSDSTCY